MRLSCAALVALGVASMAKGRVTEPGEVRVMLSTGLSGTTATDLGVFATHAPFRTTVSYHFDRHWAAVGAVMQSLGKTPPSQLSAGVEYRVAGLQMPLSPLARFFLVYGRLNNVIHTNLDYWGVESVIGADYFLTARASVHAGLTMGVHQTIHDHASSFMKIGGQVGIGYGF